MNLLRIFGLNRISAAARELNRVRIANERERIRSTTRRMREELGLPPARVLDR